MLDARSAIASVVPVERTGLRIVEDAAFTLRQFAWFDSAGEKKLKESLGALPPKVGLAALCDLGQLMRIGPGQLWLVGAESAARPPVGGGIALTELTSSRTRIAVHGLEARTLLARCAPIDFHVTAFKAGHFAMTGIHHTPVLIHCTGGDAFHVYALRSFALTVWEWLEDAARGLELGT